MGLAGLLTGNFLMVFVALLVYLGASQEGAAARGRLFTSGYPVSAAMITNSPLNSNSHYATPAMCC